MKSLTGTLLAVLIIAPIVLAQHKRSDGPSGGKAEITLPVPRSTKPTANSRDVAKLAMQLVTRNDDGAWYSMMFGAVREANVIRFPVAFVPIDLKAERRRHFGEYWNFDKVKADAYLTYEATFYSVELLCASGQYRFTGTSVDVNADGILDVEQLSKDWTEWHSTTDTPWEMVRARICQ